MIQERNDISREEGISSPEVDGISIGSEGGVDSPVVGDILPDSLLAVDAIGLEEGGIEGTETAIFFDDAFGHVVEVLLGGGIEPSEKLPETIPLGAGGIKAMGKFVPRNYPEGTVIY